VNLNWVEVVIVEGVVYVVPETNKDDPESIPKLVLAPETVVALVPPLAIGSVPDTCVVRDIVPDNWLVGKDNADRVVRVELLDAVILAAFPDMFPVTWLPGRESALSVVRVLLDDAVMLAALPEIFPVTWLPGRLKEDRVVNVEFDAAVMFAAFPDMFPVTWLPGNDNEDSVVRVELDDAVMLLAVPVVFWLRVGTSDTAIKRKAGVPDALKGAARKVFWAWLWKDANVRVPEEVIGEPVILNRPVLSTKATEVTEPVPPADIQLDTVPLVLKTLPEFPTWDGKSALMAFGAVVCPVPPFAMAIVVPSHVPDVMVPTAAKLDAVVKAERLTRVELEVAVMLPAVPVVFWLSVGTSAATKERNVGAPELPLGPANTVLADWDWKEARVRFPDVVTGVLVMLNRPVLSTNPTAVTVPPDDVEAMSIVEPAGVILIPVPATKERAPVKLLRLVTPLPVPPSTGKST
jgi:hypothetical protein